MYDSKKTRWTASVLGAILIVGGSVAPVAAAQDPGLPTQAKPSMIPYNCLLMRVGDQYVRCDNLTGDGAPAANWISEP